MSAFLPGRKKALNLLCLCFDMLDTLDLSADVQHDRPLCKKHQFRSSHISMCQWRLLQNRRVWVGVKHFWSEIHGIHWEKGRIKHMQMKGKQYWLYHLEPGCGISVLLFLFIAWSYCLTSYYFKLVIMVRFGSRGASQSHCVLGLMAHRCDYTWFFRRTTKNPVMYATS